MGYTIPENREIKVSFLCKDTVPELVHIISYFKLPQLNK